MHLFYGRKCTYFTGENALILREKMHLFYGRKCTYFTGENILRKKLLQDKIHLFWGRKYTYFERENAPILEEKIHLVWRWYERITFEYAEFGCCGLPGVSFLSTNNATLMHKIRWIFSSFSSPRAFFVPRDEV